MNEELELTGIETLLRRGAAAVRYPATPPIARAVAARLDAQAARRPALDIASWWRKPVARAAGAALAAALLAVAGAVAVPQSREALADFFGLSSVRIEVRERFGPEPPVLSPASFAQPVTLERARRLVDFDLRFPTRDGAVLLPDGVYVRLEEGVIIFVYEEEGFDLYQSRGVLFGKGGEPDPDLYEPLEFDGKRAYWFREGGHIAWFFDEEGRVIIHSERRVERATLLWEEKEVTYRLETSLSRDEAVEVARSLR